MNFMTQLGVLAIIFMILVILIKSNQTLEKIYMEEETEKETIEIPPFRMPEFDFASWKKNITGVKKKKHFVYEEYEKEEPADKKENVNKVERSFDTIPVESCPGWHLEVVDEKGRCYGRTVIREYPYTIGRASDNDYVIDDLSVSGHHACVEEKEGTLTLIDRGSLNKIIAGGRPVTEINIVNGLEVYLGNTKIRFLKEEKASDHTIAYQRNSVAEEWY